MFPKRGAFAGLLTIGLLVFLLNFRTPVPASDADFMAGMPADPPSLSAPADASFGDAIAAAEPTDETEAGASQPATDADQTAGPTLGATGSTGPGSETTPATPGNPTQAGQPVSTQPDPTQAGTGTPGPVTPGPVGSTPRPPSVTQPPAPKPTAAPPAAFSGSITGSTISTKYGPMQVKVVWSAGKITDVITLQMTNRDSHSTALSQNACPILRSEALRAQSAAIAVVSGATYTSNGYKSSLQSAISKKP
jgi:uncharacterized protein with FMN-binding domain